jgi:hypothetical protein
MRPYISSFTLLILGYLCYLGYGEFEERDAIVKEYVGTTVRINDETLHIIDYSMLHRTYTLDNGTEISHQFVLNE